LNERGAVGISREGTPRAKGEGDSTKRSINCGTDRASHVQRGGEGRRRLLPIEENVRAEKVRSPKRDRSQNQLFLGSSAGLKKKEKNKDS